MLTNLSIENYAIIDKLDIDFNPGFSVITGETGAGKSIILGALMMILGERIENKISNKSDKKSVIEATFDMSNYALESYFLNNDLEYDSKYCILRREILPTGRSRAFVNDSPVSLTQLKSLALKLVDIHSQHKNSILSDTKYHLSILDALSNNSELKKRYEQCFTEYCKIRESIERLKLEINSAKAEEDYNKFLLSQFKDINLEEEEESDLEDRQKKLSNISEIKTSLWEINNLFENDNLSIISSLKSIDSKLQDIADFVKEVNPLLERTESILIELKDINQTLSNLDSNIIDDPKELDRINNKLSQIYELKRKHNVSTAKELILIKKQLETKISAIDNGDFEIESLEKKLKIKEAELSQLANDLTITRKNAADVFTKELIEKAIPLGMKNFNCKMEFSQTGYTKAGKDNVQLLISFNKNQEVLPIANTASGGEISRLMLCIKSIIAHRMNLPTVIFDEIDTGVSGEIANKMGKMMSDVSKDMQVISITHLPQVAALGNNHYKVFKTDTAESTVTDIRLLNEDERIKEIAGMLSANIIDDAAINNAKSLLHL